MSPNCETPPSSSPPSRFVPSLACIAEEEPRIIFTRRIYVPGGSSSKPFQVEIPIYDLNIYAPEPGKTSMPESYQRLLAQMDKYIEYQSNSERHKKMAKELRQKVAFEQAEAKRLSTPNFTHRDWYWYSEETRNFVDEPVFTRKIVEKCEEKTKESPSNVAALAKCDDDEFDLNADF
ncbi:hypothetical protein GCK72_002661 [Caenorhabditis remanei]|uniref:Uncharacterized protein n=1 Tax=Caenorhabditis remanei TaxID=31234 RepID=E3LV70_CAERE|nr:hypothetical protein GCK72_002661 [Caenorhabditis remanei]EFP12721.1 hypothetical protein CRE_29685 [Caenorhabditis remanei]KAF1770837.1 hypothetical protein GCK72_002661 [Caenorhabditis remanei]